MPRVVFTPTGLSAEVPVGTTVLDTARSLGVDLDSVCGGRGICGRCQVVVEAGSFAKWAIDSATDAVTPFTETEQRYRDRRGLGDTRRLGCCALVQGDVVVDVPPDSQVHRPVVRKALALDDVVVDPAVSLYYVELPKRVLGDASSLAAAVREEVLTRHQRHLGAFAPAVLRAVHRAVASGSEGATFAVRRHDAPVDGGATGSGSPDAGTVIAVWPGFVERVGGIAIDIGSTTIAGHLCDLGTGEVLASAGRMNPQIRYGDDLMSRVSYVMMNPGGETQLTAAVRGALAELVDELTAAADVGHDRVLEIVLVGNPIMHHLLLGIDPTPLGQAPFTLATAEAVELPAVELDLPLPSATAYVGPCIAGHVGADTAAAVLAEGPHRSTTEQLLVDVGTNAEIVLGDARHQYAASSPTGPAFEGAQLSCGMRATAGAIERVRIDRDTLIARFKVIGSDLWSDDPAFADATAALDIAGICGSGIIEVIGEMYLAGVIDADGVIQGGLAARSDRVVPDGRTFRYVVHRQDGVELSITQNDVRAIQLAKAALRAGIDLLVERAGVHDLRDIRLAGAFGAHIDPLYALVLGLVPDCPLDGVRSVGNAAGVGAVRALLSVADRREMERTAAGVEKIETATEARFQELFVAAMAFPHAIAPSDHLGSIVALPAAGASRSAGGTGRSGRRRRPGAENASGNPAGITAVSGGTSEEHHATSHRDQHRA